MKSRLLVICIALSTLSFAHVEQQYESSVNEQGWSSTLASVGMASATIFNGMEIASHLIILKDSGCRPKSFTDFSILAWNGLELAGHGMNFGNYLIALLFEESEADEHRPSYYVGLSAINAVMFLCHGIAIKSYLEKEASLSNKFVLFMTGLGLIFHTGDFYYTATMAMENS